MLDQFQLALLAVIAVLLLVAVLRQGKVLEILGESDLDRRLARLEKLDHLVRLEKLDALARLEQLDRLSKLDALDRLDALESLVGLPDRLDRLEAKLESLRPPEGTAPTPVTVSVELADDLREAVRSAVKELEKDLKKILRVTGRTRADRMGTLISRRLLDEGYSNVRITGGLPGTRSGKAPVRVPVDAERDGLRYRGVVVMRGDEIEETRLSPEHLMFP